MSNPNDPDFWPKYAIFSEALRLSLSAATKHGVRNLPVHAWTHEQILLVALDTIHEENTHELAHRLKHDPG